MKVGILVECGRDGLEDVVVRRICKLLRDDGGQPAEIEIVPMDSKAQLIRECGPAAAGLLESGWDRVVILWDEKPAWPKLGERLCWHNDKQDILANLARHRVVADSVFLVCIEREFESWLLFDAGMLSRVLSRDAHQVKARPPAKPDRQKNPKAAMRKLFDQHGRGPYVDLQFAREFAWCLTALNRLRKCETFTRFAQCVTDPALKGRSSSRAAPRSRVK
jgi:hypothetical protein